MAAAPLLVKTLYRHSVSQDHDDSGAAGTSVDGYQWIEEQRQGAEWIVRGYAEQKAEWIALGWRQLDWGLGRQQADGGFGSRDPFHSTSFFVEALARSCRVDPSGATRERVAGLKRAAGWLMPSTAESRGVPNGEILQALVYGAQAFGEAAWLGPAERIAALRRW